MVPICLWTLRRAVHSSRGILQTVVLSKCDLETSIMWRPWSTVGCWAMVNKSLCCVCSPLQPNITCYIPMYFRWKTKSLFPCYEPAATRVSLLPTLWTSARILALDTRTLREPWVGGFTPAYKAECFRDQIHTVCHAPQIEKWPNSEHNLSFYARLPPMNVRFYYSIGRIKKKTQNRRVFVLCMYISGSERFSTLSDT